MIVIYLFIRRKDKIIIIATTDSTFEFNILGSRHRVNYQLVTQSFHLDIFYTNFLEKKMIYINLQSSFEITIISGKINQQIQTGR